MSSSSSSRTVCFSCRAMLISLREAVGFFLRILSSLILLGVLCSDTANPQTNRHAAGED